MQSPSPAARQIVRLRAVCERTGLPKTTLRDLESIGQFPRRISLGPRVVGWYEDEITTWVESRQRKGV
jgi:prophage regulatory protein